MIPGLFRIVQDTPEGAHTVVWGVRWPDGYVTVRKNNGTPMHENIDHAIRLNCPTGRVEWLSGSKIKPVELSPREMQVIAGLASGRKHYQIAHEMGLKTGTASNYIRRAFVKLGASNAPHATWLASAMGLLRAEDVVQVDPEMDFRR